MTPESVSEVLRKTYYNPETGFNRASILLQKVKPEIPGLNLQTVKDWLAKQETVQVFKQTKQYKVPGLQSSYPNQRWQIDLMDVMNWNPKLNQGFNYIFNCIDAYSRYAWSIPIKSKSTSDCVAAFQDILQESVETPAQLDSDNEAAFMSKEFKKLCKELKIKQHMSDPGDFKAKGFVESFNGTMREKLEEYKRTYNTQVWVDILQKWVKNYNTTEHSETKMTPAERILQHPLPLFEKKELITNFSFDQPVRVKIRKNQFVKGSKPKFSSKIYKIEKIEGNNHYVYGRKEAYKGNELVAAPVVEKNTNVRSVDGFDLETHLREGIREPRVRKEEKKFLKEKRVTRRLNKAGIDRSKELLPTKIRERAPSSRLKNLLLLDEDE